MSGKVHSIVDRLKAIQAEHKAAEMADRGGPDITFWMDRDEITFRDQAALDEYVQGALDDLAGITPEQHRLIALWHSQFHGGGADDCSADHTSPCFLVKLTRVLSPAGEGS